MQRFPIFRLGLALVGITAGTAGCAQHVAAKDGDYVTYYPTGSNLPVRVKKAALDSSDQDRAAQKQALRDAQYSGQKMRKDN